MKVKLFSRIQLLVTLWIAAYEVPRSMGFSRQEYCTGVPSPSLMTNLDSILRSRDVTLPTKAHLVKAMVFPVVMYGCESWTVKKAEHQRIDAFELKFWRRQWHPTSVLLLGKSHGRRSLVGRSPWGR